MDSYAKLIRSISVGAADVSVAQELTEETAKALLCEVAKHVTNPVEGKNNTFESDAFYMYIGDFPKKHVAIDNKSGTSRLHTLYENDLSSFRDFIINRKLNGLKV